MSGGLADDRKLHLGHNHLALVADGPDEIRKVCRVMVREGVDILKILISGDNSSFERCNAEMTAMTEAEVAAACEVGVGRGRRVAAHARSSASVKLCLAHGIDIINHATLVDEEALDLMEAKKDRIFVMPALGFVQALAQAGERWGFSRERAEAHGLLRELELGVENARKMHRRGIRVLPFGDYGFPWMPHGTKCRDLILFRDLIGMRPQDILRAATALGGELFGGDVKVGQVRPGFLADLLLVAGDPVSELELLQDEGKILMIMQNGRIHKAPTGGLEFARREAA